MNRCECGHQATGVRDDGVHLCLECLEVYEEMTKMGLVPKMGFTHQGECEGCQTTVSAPERYCARCVVVAV